VLYIKYAGELTNLGYTQDQAKTIVSNSLWSKPSSAPKTTSTVPPFLANPNK
jgi:hypothetical protein